MQARLVIASQQTLGDSLTLHGVEHLTEHLQQVRPLTHFQYHAVRLDQMDQDRHVVRPERQDRERVRLTLSDQWVAGKQQARSCSSGQELTSDISSMARFAFSRTM